VIICEAEYYNHDHEYSSARGNPKLFYHLLDAQNYLCTVIYDRINTHLIEKFFKIEQLNKKIRKYFNILDNKIVISENYSHNLKILEKIHKKIMICKDDTYIFGWSIDQHKVN
jgi:hypothetical protein